MSSIKMLNVFLLLACSSIVINNYYVNCGEVIKIAQQGPNDLDDYSSYQDISIIHFSVPDNLATVTFKFRAKEVKVGGLGSCVPRDVSIYVKPGSIPLVHPDGASVRAKLLKNRRKYYEVNCTSTGDEHQITIVNPAPGDWFAIAFRSWTDPNSEKITQQGLGTLCSTILDAEILIEPADITLFMDTKNTYQINLNKSSSTAILQFHPNDDQNSTITLLSSCGNSCKITANILAEDILTSTLLNTTTHSLSFQPFTNYFHHLSLHLLSGNSSTLSISFSTPKKPDNKKLLNNIPLIRKSLPDLFLFDYEYLPHNSTDPLPINITNNQLTIMSFKIGPINDIGGTLSIGIRLFNQTENLLVIGCISLGSYSIISDGGSCLKNSLPTPPDLWVNSSKASMIHIPYPDPGTWYLSMQAFSILKTNTTTNNNNNNCSCLQDCQSTPCQSCNCLKTSSARVETSIGSSPCIEGSCSSNGHCHHHPNSGGFVITSCHCTGGYRGFDCTDDTFVLTGGTVKIRLLMLTLSNLAFIGSIIIAFKREYYTEALVYTAVMFFSMFYHACEAGEDVISICITKISVLQFCDFYNALLSVWVTLIAMASFGPRLTGFYQISGAIVLAFCAEIDRTALWVFLLPALSGCVIVGTAWGMKCRRQRNFKYPAMRYKSVYLSTGLGIVFVGLICYAFLQTRKNYHILHSFWHICSAVGIMILLPKKKYMK